MDQQRSEESQDRNGDGGEAITSLRRDRLRIETAWAQSEAPDPRERKGRDPDLDAERRDELSRLHDELARARDEDASALDEQEELSDRHTLRPEDLRAHARATRIRAANDRARAAADRDRAARDRERAARDRVQAALDREDAGTDELTGAKRRGIGLEQLESEIERARREGQSFVAVYVDVDGLKAVNDEQGHAAGDELLACVTGRLRGHMRSYDVLIRLGGDEFLCGVPSVGPDSARERFSDLTTGEASVSLGFSELCEDDTAESLVARADADLLAGRHQRRD